MLSCYITSSKNLLDILTQLSRYPELGLNIYLFIFASRSFLFYPQTLSAALFERKKPHVCRGNYIISNCLLSHIRPHDAKKPVGK